MCFAEAQILTQIWNKYDKSSYLIFLQLFQSMLILLVEI